MTAFSKVRRWLAEVDGKLKENVAPSKSGSIPSCGGCCVLLDRSDYNAVVHSDCSSAEPFFFDKTDRRLAKHLLDIAQSILSERQKSLLVSAVQELRWNSMTLTRLCERLSHELRMSYSTVKWNVKRLAAMKLLLGGTENSKGTEARPTTLGCLIASTLTQAGTNLRYKSIRELA